MENRTLAKLSIFNGMKKNESNGHNGKHDTAITEVSEGLLSETNFRRMLCRERKRSERSRKHLLLMLIDGKGAIQLKDEVAFLKQVATCLAENVRETDLAGWFEANSVFGVIFTELGETDIKQAMNVIQTKVTTTLQKAFKDGQLSKILVSFYAFPDGWDGTANGNGNGKAHSVNPALYPDFFEIEKRKKISLVVKRGMDIVGSSLALAAASPFLVVLACAVKLSSKGPVFFRQDRVGQFGVKFKFLKFRSMKVSSDSGIHKEYVKNFIAGKAAPAPGTENGNAVYKITNDPRVTWVGKIMRRTSLDEIPQFWNVLKGDMSLVGPRPPIPYEIESYDVWHRRRLLEVRPGITGLWQVKGRSRTSFDDMVRLDLQYSRNWTPLMDAKILLQTPRAVISGNGAY